MADDDFIINTQPSDFIVSVAADELNVSGFTDGLYVQPNGLDQIPVSSGDLIMAETTDFEIVRQVVSDIAVSIESDAVNARDASDATTAASISYRIGKATYHFGISVQSSQSAHVQKNTIKNIIIVQDGITGVRKLTNKIVTVIQDAIAALGTIWP